MLLPASFNTAIGNVFYDKSFSINRKTRSKDAEGGNIVTTTLVGTHKGNIQPSVSSGIRRSLGIEERGLVDNISLAVTTSTDVDANTDDELLYDGKKYTVKGDYTYDSHLLLICENA